MRCATISLPVPLSPVIRTLASERATRSIYQDVDGMKRAIGSLNAKLDGFDASCFDGVYITGDVTAETIAAMNSQRADTAEKIGEDSDVDVSRLALPNPQEA